MSTSLTVDKILDLLATNPPEGFPKPRFVVTDNMAPALAEAWGSAAEVIPLSETMLPSDQLT